ncbi:uncharacterized protein LOC127871561 isoform X2 [Dreissena polymorpha]|uniref:uncharacterized protein LOC127871561 isoform X2 n=1 Tax=Dreissena polymorpha TaxID=45954 RepID=UPI002264011C|nr:uncharacterized protein LOC127871561 isoform X2 [Dreissena polymorpha]
MIFKQFNVEETNDIFRSAMLEQMQPDVVNIREDATGHLLCWGSGEFGQHGHGFRKEVTFFEGAVERFCGNPEVLVKHFACGSSHSAVVTNGNEIYLWGNGNNGQLGTNELTAKSEPQLVSLYGNDGSRGPEIAGVSCGGRHSVVWLENGDVFTFGNNFNAQLGFDFREKNHKETQPVPTLLRSLSQKPVAQVACGDKHSIFRFKDGSLSCVGNNAHGQIGSGTRQDALSPLSLSDVIAKPVKTIAAGSQHSLAVTEEGQLYVWGYSKACGSRDEDLLSPWKLSTHRENIVAVAGGSMHSMALSANGSVYTWGCGTDGQLGHGDKVTFLPHPRRVKDRHVISRCIQIACGETFSAATTEKGLLYMWGKNSHTIVPDKPTTQKFSLPHGVNKNFRGGRISRVTCGSWHAMALIGRPKLLRRNENEGSDESTEEILPTLDPADDDDEAGSDSEEEMPTLSRREPSRLEREKTTVSLADFYAPTPDPPRNFKTPSPEFYFNNQDEDDLDRINSTRSAATLIVQLPSQPMMSYADAATSPMTLTTTSTNTSSVTTSSRIPSPIAELPHQKIEKLHRKLSRPEKKFKEFDTQKYEREKLRSARSPVSEVVQLSRSSADSFILPREPTGISRKQVDFSEMEEIRLKGPKSPEKLSRLSRHSRQGREYSPRSRMADSTSPLRFKDGLREINQSRSRHRYLDSQLSTKSDSVIFMESPLFRGSKSNAMAELNLKNPYDPSLMGLHEERQYKHHVPKNHPRRYNKGNNVAETNFGLQISKTQTIVAPVHGDVTEPLDRLTQLRRYAAIHNPQTSSRTPPDRLRPIKNRQVSIPGGRAESPGDDKEQLFIGASAGKPLFSSGSGWKDKSDMEKMVPRKMAAAGIVKMYISNNELIGTVENPLYSNLSDGRGHSDSLLDSDSLMIQPLMKKTIAPPEKPVRSIGIELPSINFSQSSSSTSNVLTTRTVPESRHFDSEELDFALGSSTSRGIGKDRVIPPRVS